MSTRKERASKHAQRSRTCECGKTVRGNGGYTNHVRRCRVWIEKYKDQPAILARRGVIYKSLPERLENAASVVGAMQPGDIMTRPAARGLAELLREAKAKVAG